MADIKTLALPELPESDQDGDKTTDFRGRSLDYTGDDMRDYARAALDAIAEAHQAEVARLQDELRIIAGKRSLEADRCDTLVGEVARLTRENEGLREALKQCAAVVSGQTMHKQGLIDALELARAALAGASGAQEGERT
jgi:hypothetical protein